MWLVHCDNHPWRESRSRDNCFAELNCSRAFSCHFRYWCYHSFSAAQSRMIFLDRNFAVAAVFADAEHFHEGDGDDFDFLRLRLWTTRNCQRPDNHYSRARACSWWG